MAAETKPVLDRFEVRFTAQKEWRILILIAFFFGGVGGGLFLVSSFLNFTVGLVLGWLIVAVLKGTTHLVYLGHPLRFWRILTSWTALRTSWLTRGMWGLAVFLLFGALSIALLLGWLPGGETTTGKIILSIATAAAVWVMIYTGFVMAQSPAIALWHTPLLPLLFMLYGLAGGIDLTLISLTAFKEAYAINVHLLELAGIVLLILISICIWAYLGLMSVSRVGARVAVRQLTRGEFAFVFWGVVIIIGLMIPLAVSLYAYFVGTPTAITGASGLLALVGCLFFRWVLLRAGVFDTLA